MIKTEKLGCNTDGYWVVWCLEGEYGMVRMMISELWSNREYSQYIGISGLKTY